MKLSNIEIKIDDGTTPEVCFQHYLNTQSTNCNLKSKSENTLATNSNHITLKQPCRRCGGDKAFIKPTPPSSPHKAGLWCADCDSWINWVGKNQVSLLVLESLGKGLGQGGEG